MKKDIYLQIVDLIADSNLDSDLQIKMFDYMRKLKETETVCENRGKFIDYISDKNPELLYEYIAGEVENGD